MTIPLWILLGFAGWTLLLLITTIGVYRWSYFLTGKAKLKEFRADIPHGKDWYQRAMRAHANCIENLPVYTAIVIAITATHLQSPILDGLAILLLIARILQSLTHIVFKPNNLSIGIRFGFFSLQLIAMIWMGIYVALTFSTHS